MIWFDLRRGRKLVLNRKPGETDIQFEIWDNKQGRTAQWDLPLKELLTRLSLTVDDCRFALKNTPNRETCRCTLDCSHHVGKECDQPADEVFIAGDQVIFKPRKRVPDTSLCGLQKLYRTPEDNGRPWTTTCP